MDGAVIGRMRRLSGKEHPTLDRLCQNTRITLARVLGDVGIRAKRKRIPAPIGADIAIGHTPGACQPRTRCKRKARCGKGLCHEGATIHRVSFHAQVGMGRAGINTKARPRKQKSHPSPGGLLKLERARRFERPTLTLARLCSTPELRPLPWIGRMYKLMRRAASEKSHRSQKSHTKACAISPIAAKAIMPVVNSMPPTRNFITGGLAEKP